MTWNRNAKVPACLGSERPLRFKLRRLAKTCHGPDALGKGPPGHGRALACRNSFRNASIRGNFVGIGADIVIYVMRLGYCSNDILSTGYDCSSSTCRLLVLSSPSSLSLPVIIIGICVTIIIIAVVWRLRGNYYRYHLLLFTVQICFIDAWLPALSLIKIQEVIWQIDGTQAGNKNDVLYSSLKVYDELIYDYS